jgi:hypothetical protein
MTNPIRALARALRRKPAPEQQDGTLAALEAIYHRRPAARRDTPR